MQKTITHELKRLRREYKLSQAVVADKMGLKRTTYAQKEMKGDFETHELETLAKVFQINAEILVAMQHVNGDLKGVVRDPDEYRTTQALKLEAMLRVIMWQNAEVLAHIRKQPIPLVLEEAQDAVRAESEAILKRLQ